MRRIGKLVIVLASLTLITVKCSGGVNPGQARDTHQAYALAAARWAAGGWAAPTVSRESRVDGTFLARWGSVKSALPAAAQANGGGLIPTADLRKVGIPHHTGSDIWGEIKLTATKWPPRSGVAHLVLEQYFPHAHKWGDIAGPAILFLGGMTVGQSRILGPVSHYCIDHTRFRLKMYGHGINFDGFYERFTECYPGGGYSGKCFAGNKGGRYIHAC